MADVKRKVGRPPKINPLVKVSVTLDQEHVYELEKLGDGNVSQGLRTLVQEVKRLRGETKRKVAIARPNLPH